MDYAGQLWIHSSWPSAMTRFREPTDDRLPEEMMLSKDYTLTERRVQMTRPTYNNDGC